MLKINTWADEDKQIQRMEKFKNILVWLLVPIIGVAGWFLLVRGGCLILQYIGK